MSAKRDPDLSTKTTRKARARKSPPAKSKPRAKKAVPVDDKKESPQAPPAWVYQKPPEPQPKAARQQTALFWDDPKKPQPQPKPYVRRLAWLRESSDLAYICELDAAISKLPESFGRDMLCRHRQQYLKFIGMSNEN